MTLFFLPQAEGGSRIGFTVGRVLGGAVERNRIKRRLREAVRRERGRLRTAVDLVVNPKKSVERAEFAEILEEFRRAFDLISAKLRSGRESARQGK